MGYRWYRKSIELERKRELCNLIETLEALEKRGELEGVESFIFTDNSVAKSAFCKSSSSSQQLFDLILRLMMLEMNHQMHVYIIHVAGTRMIAQGYDGLSRGNMMESVVKREDIRSFIPINKSAIEEQDNLKE